MSTVEFLGTYATRGDYRLPTLPVENESGLWQVWKTAEGNYVVQPLDYSREPWGNPALMAAGDFEDAFYPLPSDEAIGRAGRGLFRSDSPDLLDYWYEQAMSSNPREEGLLRGSALGMHKRKTPSSFDVPEQEPQFTPVTEAVLAPETEFFLNDPLADAFAPPQKGTVPKSTAPQAIPPQPPADPFAKLEKNHPETPGPADRWLASMEKGEIPLSRIAQQPHPQFLGTPAPSVTQIPGRTGIPTAYGSAQPALDPRHAPNRAAAPAPQPMPGSSFAGNAPGTPDAFPAPAPQAPPLPKNVNNAGEDRIMMQENAMYSEFSQLVEKLKEGSQPTIEAAIERLLQKGTGFTWRQKFMFSEFGMTLRRKKKFRLALLSHRRALALAPKDEHVLFNMARSEYDLGNVEVAREYLKKALESDPQFQVARNFLEFLSSNR